jgi:hypothetical protein
LVVEHVVVLEFPYRKTLVFPHRLIPILAGRKITVTLPDLLELFFCVKVSDGQLGGPVSQIFFKNDY